MFSVNASAFLERLRVLQADIAHAGKASVAKAVEAATKAAKGTTLFKDKTGATRNSIRGESNGTRGFVRAGGASKWLENGTRPHRIDGNPFLRFVKNGAVIYRRFVHHPGTVARPFMANAAREGERALYLRAEEVVQRAIDRFNR